MDTNFGTIKLPRIPVTTNTEQNGGRPRAHPAASAIVVAGLAFIPLGVIGWIWTAEWRWALTGLLALLTTLIVSGAVNVALVKPNRRQVTVRPPGA